jgi:hypothetical protein
MKGFGVERRNLEMCTFPDLHSIRFPLQTQYMSLAVASISDQPDSVELGTTTSQTD